MGPVENTEAPQDAAPEAPACRIEQADHVELVQKIGAMREKRQAFAAAQAAQEVAQLRLELARRDTLDADAACVAVEQRLQAKYGTKAADQYDPSGAIWRAQG